MARRADSDELFAVGAGGERLRSTGYRLPLKHYALAIWPDKDPQSSIKRLRRWISVGEAAGDPPPLDSLADLADWFERHHKWRAGRELVALRDGVGLPEAAPPPAAPGKAEKPAEEPAMPAMVFDLDVEMSVDTGLRQIRALVDATYRQMQIAIETGRMKEYQTLRREWSESIKLLRQWEKDVVKIQEGRGEVLRTRVINSELVQIFTSLGQSFFNAMVNLLAVHAPEMPANDRWKVAVERRDLVFSHLNRSRFAEAWQASESPEEKAA